MPGSRGFRGFAWLVIPVVGRVGAADGNDLETSVVPPVVAVPPGRAPVGRLLPAVLPSASAEPADAVKGSRRPATGRRAAVSLDGGRRWSYRGDVASPCGVTGSRWRAPAVRAAGEDASEASARSRRRRR